MNKGQGGLKSRIGSDLKFEKAVNTHEAALSSPTLN